MSTHSSPSQRKLNVPLAQPVANLWRWLAEPHPSIQEPERRRTRQLSALLVVLIASGTLAAIVTARVNGTVSDFRTILAAAIVLAIAYAFNRARRYGLAAVLTVGVVFASVWFVAITRRQPGVLEFLILSLLLSSLFLSPRITILVFAAATASTVLFWLLVPGSSLTALIDTGFFIGVVGVMVIVGTTIRQRDLEQIERQSLELAGKLEERTPGEAALRDSEAELRALFAAMSDVVIVYDRDGRYLEIAPTNASLLYQPPDDMIGRTLHEVLPAPQADLLLERLQRALDTQRTVTVDYSLIIGGREIWFAGAISPMKGDVAILVAHDLTNRQRSEVALRESEARFRNLVERLPGIAYIAEHGEGGAWHYVSPQIETILGFTPDEWMADPHLWFKQLHPDDRERALADDAEDWERGVSKGEAPEYRLFRRDDSAVWVRDEAVLVLDDAGQPLYWQGVLYDVTERKQAEQALQESERRFRALIENSLDAITLLGPDGTVIYDSPAAPGLLGYSTNGLVGRNAFEFVHPDDLERVKALFGQMLQDSHARVSGIFRFQHKNGSWRWIEGTGTNLLGEPSVRAIVLNYRDITDRRQAEEQIQRRAEELLAVNALGRALAESLELSEIYARLYQAILGLLPDSSTVFVSLFDRARELLVCAYGVQDGEQLNVDELPPIPLEPPGVGSQSEAIHTRRPFIVNDLQARLRRVKVNVTVGHSGPFPQSGLYVPMLAKGEVIGVVMVQCPTLSRYSQSDADLLSVVANTAAVAIENARLFDDAERRLRQTQALNNIDRAISGSTDLRFTLKTVLDEVTSQLQVDAGDILLLNPHTHTLEYGAGRGFHTQALQHTRLRLGEGYAGRAALERRFVSVPDLRQRTTDLLRSPYFVSEAFIAYYGVPLSAKGQVVGVLEIFHRAPLSPDREWLDFLEALAGQAALAIDNATLFEGLERSNVELALAYDATIEGWSRALDLRDKETEGHTQRVTNLTVRLARALGLSQAELVHIRRGALLHDIGKMGVPDGILLKAGALTDQEWAVMRRHPVYAYEMLSPIAYLRPALDIPYCHHEKWDGTGYPRGLKGDQIPLAALIFAVVDVWDALRSDRPYRAAWPEEKVREHIRQQSGTHFDPKVVDKFLQMELR